MNYSTIKQIAAENGLKVADLIALAPQNDPFYTGRPAELEAAAWFSDLWRRFGYNSGVHLRRIHYQAVSNKAGIMKPNGERYENTLNDWKFLTEAGKWARYLGLVSPGAFVDRRNPDAIIHAHFDNPGDWNYRDPAPGWSVRGNEEEWSDYTVPELPELPELPYSLPHLPDYMIRGYNGVQQEYLVEVWAEKTTMNDILDPLCRRYRANLVTGAGELSITAVLDFLKRARSAKRPARILYVSDFDPAGLGMPISVARKIEFFVRNEGWNIDAKLEPVVLLQDQIERYDLPKVPVKDSDLRKAHFERDHGKGQVELDALEAIYPGELKKIVTEAILQYYDPDLEERAGLARGELKVHLENVWAEKIQPYAGAVQELQERYENIVDRWEETRRDFREMIEKCQLEIDAYSTELEELAEDGRKVYEELKYHLEDLDLDPGDIAPLPEPELPDDPETQLYDSDRDYGNQLAYYKMHRHGDNGGWG